MFSGIVEEFGLVQAVTKKENLYVLAVQARKVLGGTHIGDSICVNGVCLTVTERRPGRVAFDVMKETIQATTLKHARPGQRVNLERALKANGRLGGHFVSGHVDGVGRIRRIVTLPNYVEFQVALGASLMRYIAPKGSVAIDGVSLTIGEVQREQFSVYLIPHTLTVTTFGQSRAGDEVNIETDILAKYILKDR